MARQVLDLTLQLLLTLRIMAARAAPEAPPGILRRDEGSARGADVPIEIGERRQSLHTHSLARMSSRKRHGNWD